MSVEGSTGALVGPALHVDGLDQVAPDPGTGLVKRSSTPCTGSCHGSSHTRDRW